MKIDKRIFENNNEVELTLCKKGKVRLDGQTDYGGATTLLLFKPCNCHHLGLGARQSKDALLKVENNFLQVHFIITKMSSSEEEGSDAEMSVNSEVNVSSGEGSDVDMDAANEEIENNFAVTRSQIDDRIAAIHSSSINALSQTNIKGEPGHIQQISLHNFMCHENFTVDLGPRINFIIGPNGSMYYFFCISQRVIIIFSFFRRQICYSWGNYSRPRMPCLDH